jgi:Pretoxin HINT domain
LVQSYVAHQTLIQTRDGEKAIQDIQIGDWVLSDDPTTPGGIEYKQVIQTFTHETNYLVDVYIGGEKITTTENHPFWVKDVGWVAARDLGAGSLLETKTESWLGIDRVEKHTEVATVYNFEVQGFHTYFVSDLGLLVHNACVDTRINIANDRTRFTPIRPSTGNPVSAGFDHVLKGHFNRELGNNRSIFNITPDELKTILQSKDVVSSPVRVVGDGHFERIVDVGQIVGNTSLKSGGNPTSTIKILTDSAGNLITTYPIP